MVKINNKSGLTLVEIVISLAILGIMTIAFMNVFLGSYMITNRAGSRSDSVAEAASMIDLNLATSSAIVGTITSATIIYKVGAGGSESVNGKLITRQAISTKGQKIELKYFLPD